MTEQVAEAGQAAETQAQVEVEQPTEDQQSQENAESEQQPGESNADYEQRLKTADNLIRKLKFQRKEEQRQRTDTERQLAELRKELDQLKAPKEPHEDDPEWRDKPFSDLIIAKAVHAAKQAAQQLQNSDQPFTQEQALQLARQQLEQEQRFVSVQQQAQELSSKVPDYVQVHTANLDILEELPQHASQAIYEAENGALAFYTLAKTGQLEQLASMTPVQAAYAVARAEAEGRKFLTKTTTQAPPPLKGARGASSVPSDGELSGKELLKKYGVS